MTSQWAEIPGDDDSTLLGPLSSSSSADRVGNAGRAGDSLTPGTRIGPFEIVRAHGNGGFAIVYLAQDHALQRRVALKEYMPAQLASRVGPLQVEVRSESARETFKLGLASFVNEARLLARFDHPALVKVFHFWEANGTAYMAMPFYDGMTLKDYVRSVGGNLDEAWLLALLAPLMEALLVIHGEQCYHRDIAPDNIILLAGSGKPVLLDFGAARRIIGEQTQALTVILKPGYAPVEQYADSAGVRQGPWTDVYALAAVVYFAITGKAPPASVARLVRDDHIPLASCAQGSYSERFLKGIDRGLAIRPEDRPQSIDAFRAEIGLTTGQGVASTTTLHPPQRELLLTARRARPSGSTRKAATWAGASLFLAAGLVAAALMLFRSPEPAVAVSRDQTVLAPAEHSPDAIAGSSSDAAAGAPENKANFVDSAATESTQRPYSSLDELDRIVKSSTPGFGVQALPSQPQFRVGRDMLAFRVRSERNGLVYVLLHASDGSLVLLFPNARSAQNRIRAGQTLTLPQASWPMETAEPVGQQRFVVLVSQWPRDFSGISQGRDAWFLKLPTGEPAKRLVSLFGGRGSPLAGLAKCEGKDCDAYGAAAFDVEVVR